MRTPLLNSLALLLLFIGSVVALALLVQTTNATHSPSSSSREARR